MKKDLKPVPWLYNKYGKLMSPFVHEMKVQNHSKLCSSNKIDYSYAIKGKVSIPERVEQRNLVFKDPNTYDGLLGMQGYQE